MTVEHYNEMTPNELNMFVDEFMDKVKRESEEKITTAYMTAYWHRVETLEPLNKILGKEEKPKTDMTNEEMLLKVEQLNKLFGGSVE